MKKLVLFGDSLLAQVSKSELLLLEDKLGGEYDVYNCAVGGWDTSDLVQKAPYIARLEPDVLLLSVGTNDASHWKQVELSKFKVNLTQVLDEFKGSRILFFLPPPTNNMLEPKDKIRSPETMKEYYDAAKLICESRGIEHTESWTLFSDMIEPNDTFHVEDGVHITKAGYAAIFEAFAEVLNS